MDCEANGKCPSMGKLTEFGAVAYPSKATFHGVLVEHHPVHDAMGNLEAFERLIKGDRPKL